VTTPEPGRGRPPPAGGAAGAAAPPWLVKAVQARYTTAVLSRVPPPVRAGGVELLGEMERSGYLEPPSLVRRGDGQTLTLTPVLREVLAAIDGRRGYADIAAEAGRRTGRTLTVAQTAELVESKLRPLGLLLGPDGSEPAAERANPLLALRLKFVVSDPELTRRICAPFAGLFRPAIIATVLTAFALTSGWVLLEKGLGKATYEAFHEPGLLLLVFALTVVSAGFHEFGHAAACRYGGATPGAMGAGLYLVWPAFYTDVTDSYRLGRGGRLRVDLGGLYFNAIFAVATFAVWALVRWDALLLVIAAQLLQMLRQLIPVVRFDGYHILADLTGVPDLFAHIKPILAGLLPERWRGPRDRSLKPWVRAVVTAWVLTVVPVLAACLVLMVLMLPRLAATAWSGLGLQWEALGENWVERDMYGVGVRFLSVLALCVPVLSIVYLIVRIVRRTVRRVWAAVQHDPRLRAGALAGAVVIAAGVAWAWWPQGQYQPVDPDEPVPLLPSDEQAERVTLVADAWTPESRGMGAVDPDEPVPLLLSDEEPGRLTLLVDASAPGRRSVGAAAPRSRDVPDRQPPMPSRARAPATDRHLGASDGARPPDHARGRIPDPLPGTEPRPPDPPGRGPGDGGGGPEDRGPPGARDEQPPPDDPAPPDDPDPPLPLPEGGSPHNEALAVNETDGTTVHEVALSFTWATDGRHVRESNEAYALASCVDCEAVAIAFQVVLIVGHTDVVAPVNVAVAYNEDCDGCTSHAVAVQLVATLGELPEGEALQALTSVWEQLQGLAGQFESWTLGQVHALLLVARDTILHILEQSDLLAGREQIAGDVSSTEH
jgi:putative peptide zinc metalloprotease protein